MLTTKPITIDDLQDAAKRIAPFAHRTPVFTSRGLSGLAGRDLFFKCENFQKVGAFKFRGACNAVMKLDDDRAARGVVTHSSGNHAQALALAAHLRGIPAHIVMPTNASAVKRRAVAGYGARIVDCAPTLQSRETFAARVVEETGGTLIHPYDNPAIIAGQGTAARELFEEINDLELVIAPVGGGGLISGTAIAAGALPSPPRIVGVEPAGADDAARSLAAGRLIEQTDPQTVADGLRTSLGQHTWPIIRDHVSRILTVTDEEIVRAMRLIWERMKIIVEPSAATVLAAVLGDAFQSESARRIGLIVSGGNVDLDCLPWIERRRHG